MQARAASRAMAAKMVNHPINMPGVAIVEDAVAMAPPGLMAAMAAVAGMALPGLSWPWSSNRSKALLAANACSKSDLLDQARAGSCQNPR